ncbi:MAG: carbonic anhydrase [Pseudobdellovibrio sp.]|nr:carbonic anhydrase [Pseudobdellovibrio sp.]
MTVAKSALILTFVFSFNLWANKSTHADESTAITPEKSLGWLINGNKRFLNSKLRADGQSASDIRRLSTDQKPHAIILSCSDSRVPPEIVFDQKLGEVFVVRTAGEALGDNAIGSIEYALEHLGSKLIVVMGHTSCGAVKAAHATLNGSSAGTPALDNLVKDIHPHITKYKGKTPSAKYMKESWSNTEGVAIELVKRSKLIRNLVKSGAVRIVPSLYDLESGEVTFKTTMEQTKDQKVDLRVPASHSHEH